MTRHDGSAQADGEPSRTTATADGQHGPRERGQPGTVAPPDSDVLASHLRGLDADALASFVATLWAARGFETSRVDGVVVAERDGERLVVAPIPAGRLGRSGRVTGLDRVARIARSARLGRVARVDAAGARGRVDRRIDVVVAPGRSDRGTRLAREHDARLLDAGDLHGMLWFGIDRRTAVEVCEATFGAPPGELRPPLVDRLRAGARERTRRARESGGTGSGPVARAGGPLAVVVLAVVVAVVAGGVLAGPGLGLGPGVGGGAGFEIGVDGGSGDGGSGSDGEGGEGGPGDDPGGSDGLELEDDDDYPVGDDTGPGTTNRPVAGVEDVPGLSADGISNLTALANAHDGALANRSYTIWIDEYEPRDREPGATRIQRDIDVEVDGDRYLLATTVETGNDRTLVERVYHDGRTWYVAERVDRTGRVTYRRVPVEAAASPVPVPPEPIVFRRFLVLQYLATPETAVTGRVTVDGEPRYRVVGTGSPWSLGGTGLGNYSVVALVDRRGLVRQATAEYTVSTPGGSYEGRFEWTYDRLGTTTVEKPSWVETEFGPVGGDATGSANVTVPSATATTGPDLNESDSNASDADVAEPNATAADEVTAPSTARVHPTGEH